MQVRLVLDEDVFDLGLLESAVGAELIREFGTGLPASEEEEEVGGEIDDSTLGEEVLRRELRFDDACVALGTDATMETELDSALVVVGVVVVVVVVVVVAEGSTSSWERVPTGGGCTMPVDEEGLLLLLETAEGDKDGDGEEWRGLLAGLLDRLLWLL